MHQRLQTEKEPRLTPPGLNFGRWSGPHYKLYATTNRLLVYRERAIGCWCANGLFRRLRSVSVLSISTRNFPNCMKD